MSAATGEAAEAATVRDVGGRAAIAFAMAGLVSLLALCGAAAAALSVGNGQQMEERV